MKNRKRLVLGTLDSSEEILDTIPFAGWSYVNKSLESSFDSILFPDDPLSKDEEYRKMEVSYDKYFNFYFPKIVKLLNTENKTNRSFEYWRIIAAPWLSCIIQTVLERNARLDFHINTLKSESIDVEVVEFLESRFFKNSYDFQVNGMRNPHFQEWILSKLIDLRESEVPPNWNIIKRTKKIKKVPILDTEKIIFKIKFFIKNLFSIYGVKGISHLLNLRLSIYLLMKKTKQKTHVEKKEIQKIEGIDFWNIIIATLPERYKTISKRESYFKIPFLKKAIITSGTQLYTEDKQKEYFASFVESGGCLYTYQHGSNYGYIKYFTYCNEIEYKHNRFITWGWEKQGNYNGVFFPLKSPQLSLFAMDVSQIKNEEIIFVGTAMPACFDNIMSIIQPKSYIDYRKEKVNFLSNLNINIFEKLSYRPYFNSEYLYDERIYLDNAVPKLKILDGDLHSRLLSAKVVVLDNPGTTLNLCMAANIPVVCFWNKENYIFTEEGESLFTNLEKVGILHSDSLSAANTVNRVYEDIETWWSDEGIQSARINWVNKYALHGEDWKTDWKQFCRDL